MKRLFTLIVLLGLVAGALVTGCSPSGDSGKTADTNAPATTATNTAK